MRSPNLRGMLRRWRQRRAWNRLSSRGKLLVRYLDPGAVPEDLSPAAKRVNARALRTAASALRRAAAQLEVEARAEVAARGTRYPGVAADARRFTEYAWGLRCGRLDRSMGARSRYAEHSGGEYAQGYTRGVLGLDEPAGRAL